MFASQTVHGVAISPSAGNSLNLKLQIETATQTVQVADSASDSSPQNSGDAIVIKGSDLDMLSADSNQLQQLQQGIAGTGGDGSPQLYVVGFSGGKMPPENTIREIRINDNLFSAEYEEQGFNRMEILTRPGLDTVRVTSPRCRF